MSGSGGSNVGRVRVQPLSLSPEKLTVNVPSPMLTRLSKRRKLAIALIICWFVVTLLYRLDYDRFGIYHAGRPWGDSMLRSSSIVLGIAILQFVWQRARRRNASGAV